MTEYARLDRPNYTDAEERALLKPLEKRFTLKEYFPWKRARDELCREFLDTLPTPEEFAAPYGGPCHRLLPPVLAITKEPVTDGVMEEAIVWLCDHTRPYRRLSGRSGPIGDNDLSNNLGPGDFALGSVDIHREFMMAAHRLIIAA
ncbi:hypothetical protein [Halovulum sp. GXIMD14793]